MDWRGFFDCYEVAVDWPACSFYEEIMETFPKAHVILTVRDPEPWYESTRKTIYQLRKATNGPLPVRAAFALAGMLASGPTGVARLADRIVWEDTFDQPLRGQALRTAPVLLAAKTGQKPSRISVIVAYENRCSQKL